VGKRIFVGNLAYSTTDDSLRAHFEAKGHEVRKATVVLDRETGRSRGFAFVDFDDNEDLEAIISANHERDLDGRRVTVTEAVERPRGGGPGGPGGPRGPRPGGDAARPSYGDRPRGPGGPGGAGGSGGAGGPGGYHGGGGGGGGGYPRRPTDSGGPPPRPFRDGPPPEPGAAEDAEAPSRKRREKPALKRREEPRPAPRRSEREEERRPNNKWRGGRGWEADDEDDE
jgi:RNA recognition motif-containing protein